MTDVRAAIDAAYDEAAAPADAYDGDLDALLRRTADYFRRYVVVDEPVPTVVACWVAMTYVAHLAQSCPYVHWYSPEPGSGKSLALEVTESVAHCPVMADGISPSALFRLIDMLKPSLTFLLDEVDTVFHKNAGEQAEQLRAVLNAGYRQGRAVWRNTGPQHKPTRFVVYGPKMTAGLRELPPSLHHRSIQVSMKPALPHEARDDFEYDDDDRRAEADAIRAALAAWAVEAEDDFTDRARKPDRLDDLDARRNEISRPLLRIADLAAGRWPADVRAGLVTLLVGEDVAEATAGRELLTAVREVFDSRLMLNPDKLSCRDLAEGLNILDGYGYRHWNDGNGITTRELGRKLARYGIRVKTIRLGDGSRPEGYDRDQFEDAWARYCPKPAEADADDGDGLVADW